jgi:hypothetical protein
MLLQLLSSGSVAHADLSHICVLLALIFFVPGLKAAEECPQNLQNSTIEQTISDFLASSISVSSNQKLGRSGSAAVTASTISENVEMNHTMNFAVANSGACTLQKSFVAVHDIEDSTIHNGENDNESLTPDESCLRQRVWNVGVQQVLWFYFAHLHFEAGCKQISLLGITICLALRRNHWMGTTQLCFEGRIQEFESLVLPP